MKIPISERFDLVIEDGGRSQWVYDKRDQVARIPREFKMACSRVELDFLQGALRRLIEQQEQERRESGVPLLEMPIHRAILNAAFGLNVDIPEHMRRYAEVL